MTPPHPENKRVLVVDGGGFRGLGCLLVIDSIMKAAIVRARKPLLPCNVFDLISGTSTGGLIAVLLGRLGLDCATAIEVYKDLTKSICGNNEQVFWETLLGSIDIGIESKTYEETLARIVATYSGHSDALMSMSEDSYSGRTTHQSTRTLVTVASDAPTYSNHTYCIRSYPVDGGPPTSPVGHQWLIREAARATVASKLFMPPLFISSKYAFRDAGFSGFNNPIDLARRDAEKLWGMEKVGVVVNIGTGLSTLAPPNAGREWAVTDQYARTFAERMVSKIGPSTCVSEASRKNAVYIVKQLVTLAVDTGIAQAETISKFFSNDVYVRIDPPLGITNIDLVDCFYIPHVETTVKIWLNGEGQKYISDIAEKLVELNTEPLTVEGARFVVPPPAPPNTNLGYNPRLDERRPDNMVDYLRNYHVYFIIDDSGSMQGKRWSETQDALMGIAEHALIHNTNEIDLRFLNSPSLYRGVKGAASIISIFGSVKPIGPTPTGAILKVVLDDHIMKLSRATGRPEYSTIKPLDIIVLTDGVPTDKPKDIMVEAVARMKAAKHHPNSIGVQIVQIGNDPDADVALKDLMYGDVGNMVDTVPYNGKLTSKILERILLGGLHPNIRAMLPT